MFVCLFHEKNMILVPMEEVTSQLVDVKMQPAVIIQHLELEKDLLLDVKVIKRSVIFR